MEKRIEYDLTYIRTWTLWLDLRIMSCTLFVVFKPENVY
ncbi:MAG: capsular polysaccharide biosynthesis protein, partial [Gammaproteobacteria bacterium]|nr:capsular polysaccharide biosynthesis protein [Gammaproteobacteria bacterium]